MRVLNGWGRGARGWLFGMIASFALVLAPLALASSHGPAAFAEAVVSAAADQDQDHAHAHDGDQPDAPYHDASDHDHSVAVILSGRGTWQLLAIEGNGPGTPFVWMPQRPEGPRRPPRETAV